MKIRTLRIHGFGRLGDREYRFGEGLTLVHGRNESGKSTLHTALTASAFGWWRAAQHPGQDGDPLTVTVRGWASAT